MQQKTGSRYVQNILKKAYYIFVFYFDPVFNPTASGGDWTGSVTNLCKERLKFIKIWKPWSQWGNMGKWSRMNISKFRPNLSKLYIMLSAKTKSISLLTVSSSILQKTSFHFDCCLIKLGSSTVTIDVYPSFNFLCNLHARIKSKVLVSNKKYEDESMKSIWTHNKKI